MKNSLPIIGLVFEADFGEKAFHLYYKDKNTLILTDVRGPDVGKKQILDVKIIELRANLYMVNWQEANKLTVTDIEDYEKQVVYANITTPKDKFVTLKGTLKPVEQLLEK